MQNRLESLLRGDPDEISSWLEEPDVRWAAVCILIVLVGGGLYGFTVGLWRAPLQSLYTAIKFPLLILLTCAGNALLNGILAQILGSGLSFRQTSLAILMSFALTSLILGALSPVSLFVLCNTPPLDPGATSLGHSVTLLIHVFSIACAGVIANRRLYRLLEKMSGSRATARRVLFGWLGGNFSSAASSPGFCGPSSAAPNWRLSFCATIRCAAIFTRRSAALSGTSFSQPNEQTQ
jgi:hypothetical protein